MYRRENKCLIGAKCKVFPQDHSPDCVLGVIIDVFNEIVTVEITADTWRWKKMDQIWFPKHQVWPLSEKAIQLSLFNQ